MKHTLLSVDEFTKRRERFINAMSPNSIALFSAATEVTRSNDTEFPFCQNKNFYYLTGFNEPDAVLVLINSATKDEQGSRAESILFCREKNPLQEVWHGRRIGPENAVVDYGFEQCFAISELNELIPQYLNHKSELLFCHSDVPAFDKRIFSWLTATKSGSRQGNKAPTNLVDCTSVIHDMRLIKSRNELEIMRKANLISGHAHQRAM